MNKLNTDRREMSLRARLSQPEPSAPPWSLLGALLITFAMLICMIGVGPALATFLMDSDMITPFWLMLSWTIGMACTVVFVVVNRRSSAESWRGLQLRRGETPLPIVMLLGVSVALVIDLIVGLGSGRFLPIPEILGFHPQDARTVLVALLLLVLFQPLAETLVFQAVLLPSLRWSLGPWRGVLVTIALNVAMHYLVFPLEMGGLYSASWHSVIYPALIGSAFCLLKLYTTSTSAVIISRMAAGLVFLLTALVLTSG